MHKKIKWLLIGMVPLYAVHLLTHGVDGNSWVYNLIRIFSSSNNFLLLLYSLSFLALFLLYQRRKKAFDTGSLLYLIYVAAAFGSCWYYSQEDVDIMYPDISLAPLLFLFVTINVCLFPLWNARFPAIQRIEDRGMEGIYNAISVGFAVLSVPPLLSLLGHFSFSLLVGSNLGNMYEADLDKAAMFFAGPSKVCFALIRRFEMLVYVLFFYQLTKGKKLLCLSMLVPLSLFVLFKLLSGSRGGIVGSALLFVTMYLMLRGMMAKPTRHLVERVGAIGAVGVALMLAAISISRFSLTDTGRYTIDRWISQYLGEAIPRFSDDCWAVTQYMDGNQNFILLRKIFGLPYIADYNQLLSIYEASLGLPVNVFYTFMGDVYLDFGLVGSLLFSVAFALVFARLLRMKGQAVTIPQLVCLALFYNFLGFGFAANVYRTIFIQEGNMWLLLLTFALYLLQQTKRHKFTPPLCENVTLWYRAVSLRPCFVCRTCKVYAA